MNFQILRFSVLCWALALIVGCGVSPGSNGGSSGSNSGGSPTVVTFTFTGVTPTVVATKTGSGPFIAVPLTSGTVTINVPSGVNNFAVAYTCSTSFPPSGNGPSVVVEQDVYEATTLDGSAFTGSCLGAVVPASPPATGTLTGSVDASAIPGASSLDVYAMGDGFDSAFGSPSSNASGFGFAAPTGSDRVLVLAYNDVYSPPALAGSTTVVAARSFENQAVPGAVNGGNPVVLAPSDETTPVPITLGSLPAGFTLEGTTANLVTSSGNIILAAPATGHYPALPAGAMESVEYYSVNASATNGTGVTSISRTSPTAVPVAFTFPAGWSYAGPTPASMAIFDLAYAGFSGTNGISYAVSGVWSPAGLGEQHVTVIHATGNYLGGGTSITWPDLSSVTGFYSPPASGSSVLWGASVTQTTYASQPASPANATVTTVGNSGHYIVP